MYIIDSCLGTDHGVIKQSQRKNIDGGNSSTWAGSMFAQFNGEGRRVLNKKSHDKIVLGYSFDGLPFQIVVDGDPACDAETIYKFIDNHVLPLMDDYARALSQSKSNPDEITKNTVVKIRNERSKFSAQHRLEFKMSVAMTYEKNGHLQCSGFGIGDTGIAIKRSTGIIDQLVTNNEVDCGADAFDYVCAPYPTKTLLPRNSLFTIKIKPGDEIVGYTYVHKELELEQTYIHDNEKIKKKKLSINKLDDISLFDYLINENTRSQSVKLANAKRSDQWGDEATFGQIIVPDNELRERLKAFVTLNSNLVIINQPEIKAKVQKIVDITELLIAKSGWDASLSQAISLTNELLISRPGEMRQELIHQYYIAANEVQGKPSLGCRILGGLMLTLGIALGTAGVLISTVTLGVGLGAGIGMTAAGSTLTIAGAGFFFHGRQKGMSKELVLLADIIKENGQNQFLNK